MDGVIAVVLGLLLALAGSAQPTTRPVVHAVWFQPSSSDLKWKSRGIDTLLGYESEGGTVSVDAWCKTANDAGLNYILQTGAGTEAHWNDPRCIGIFLSPDEPNSGLGSKNRRTPGQWTDAALDARSKAPSKPIIGNIDGTQIWMSDAVLAAYLAPLDVIVFDYHAFNRGEGQAGFLKAQAFSARCQKLAPGKPVWYCVETSFQKLNLQDWLKNNPNCRAPTPAELAAEHKLGVAGGGVVAFPDVLGVNWEAFDGTTDILAGALTVLNLAS
jgi:hypothetical protein